MPFVDSAEKLPVEVRTVSLDSYCAAAGVWPSLVKIDVEGAELMVLRGAAKVLDRHPVLIVGTHPHWLPAGQSVDQLLGLLTAAGYAVAGYRSTYCAGFEVGDYLCTPAAGK